MFRNSCHDMAETPNRTKGDRFYCGQARPNWTSAYLDVLGLQGFPASISDLYRSAGAGDDALELSK